MEKRYGIKSSARDAARMLALWEAHQIVSSGSWVALDTETTGRGIFDQVIEVSLCDSNLSPSTWRIKPTVPIQQEATHIHGIREADLSDAPNFAQVWPLVEECIAGRRTVMFNVEFDYARIMRSARAHQMNRPRISGCWCVMSMFARFSGQKNGRGEYQYQSLLDACLHAQIPLQEEKLHTSAHDATLTAQLLLFLAAEYSKRSGK